MEEVEGFDVYVEQRQLALGALLERAVESTAEVVGIEGKKILVDHELLLFDSNLDGDQGLEASALESVS